MGHAYRLVHSLLFTRSIEFEVVLAGLLTCSLRGAFPSPWRKQWRVRGHEALVELTAAGTVPESHRFPF